MKKYIILDTESTRDFAESLIGMIFEGEYIEKNEAYKLNTCDGELLFDDDEIKEVHNYSIEYTEVENLNNPICRKYINKTVDKMQDKFNYMVESLRNRNKKNAEDNYLGGIVLKLVLKEENKIVMEKYFIN